MPLGALQGGLGEPLDERLVQVLGHDEPLGGVAGLTGVVEPRVDGGFHGGVEVVGGQHDERVGTTELQHDLLEVPARDLGDGRAGSLRAGQRHAGDAGIGDDRRRLVVGGVDVHVGPGGEAGVVEDLLHGGRGLGALRGVFEQDGVADAQVRAGEPGHLVVREVPRHDAEQHPDRKPPDQGDTVAVEQVDGLVGEELLGVVGVVGVDVGGEVDLVEALVERLAHLPVDDGGQLVAAFGVQVGHAVDQGRPICDTRAPRPAARCLAGGGDRLLDLGVGGGRVLAENLSSRGIGDGVLAHVLAAPLLS